MTEHSLNRLVKGALADLCQGRGNKAGWIDGLLAILRPFQQYFSHIRTRGDDNERLCSMEPCL